ncbi:OLC1v1013090C1 [Oldenlandia corymbosa var. corymbosa]|uniref:OLC1v1013090C1 n=1 Tax=Oldenlandia corymbosa var. corymbosa TaxID=529605 RepID=A0AAV1DZH2_OLDCO|nr:OLC1v1013090C1 [Oldenlandia corymbosa var. corymbosa]
MKPWTREKIGGGRNRRNPFRPSQLQDHAEGSGQQEQENPGGENVGGGKEMGGDNMRRENDVGSSRGSYTPHEEEIPVTITLGGDSQVLNVQPIHTIRPEPQEQGVRKFDRTRNPPVNFTPPTIPRRQKK